MARHEQPDVTFDYPAGWQDRTVVAYAAPTRPSQPTATNIVLTRDRLNDGESLKAYSDRQLIEMAKRLDAYQLIERSDLQIDGTPAAEIRFSWRGSAGVLVQRLTMIALKEGSVLNFTCTAVKKDVPEYGPIFDCVLSSIKLNQG